eukprot:SAG11_NODE_2935_length_2827_cov_1.932185_1_plen_396_part_00
MVIAAQARGPDHGSDGSPAVDEGGVSSATLPKRQAQPADDLVATSASLSKRPRTDGPGQAAAVVSVPAVVTDAGDGGSNLAAAAATTCSGAAVQGAGTLSCAAATLAAATPATGRAGGASSARMRTEYSVNSRSKCQLCKLKIVKGMWRIQLEVLDTIWAEVQGRPAPLKWQSCHAACYFRNVDDGLGSRPTTQSMPYWGQMPDPGWSRAPVLSLPVSEAGAATRSALGLPRVARAADDPAAPGVDLAPRAPFGAAAPLFPVHLASLNDLVARLIDEPKALGRMAQACAGWRAAVRRALKAAVAAALPGFAVLGDDEQEVLQIVCLHRRLSNRAAQLLNSLEAAEAGLVPQTGSYDGDPLKGKFTQYSPNSSAHCRDCQRRLMFVTLRSCLCRSF